MTAMRFTIPLVALAAVALAIQFIPVDRNNPPVEEEVTAPPPVLTTLQRACFDCHSNRTVWPWYSRVAPVSWLVAADVAEARGKLNFSTWNRYSSDTRQWLRQEIWEEVSAGAMPPLRYRLAHRSAALSEPDRSALQQWATADKP